jgi:hypothetical protein
MAMIIGAITAGKRDGHDKLIKAIVSAGFAGAMCLYLLHTWNADRAAERAQRHQEHIEMVDLMKTQHQEDLSERRRMACVNEQMTNTVRAAIWRERPRDLEACK